MIEADQELLFWAIFFLCWVFIVAILVERLFERRRARKEKENVEAANRYFAKALGRKKERKQNRNGY